MYILKQLSLKYSGGGGERFLFCEPTAKFSVWDNKQPFVFSEKHCINDKNVKNKWIFVQITLWTIVVLNWNTINELEAVMVVGCIKCLSRWSLSLTCWISLLNVTGEIVCDLAIFFPKVLSWRGHVSFSSTSNDGRTKNEKRVREKE